VTVMPDGPGISDVNALEAWMTSQDRS
jgi:hypothetical protein